MSTAKTLPCDAARQCLARQRRLCRAPRQNCTAKTFPCVPPFAVRRDALPCPPPLLCVAPLYRALFLCRAPHPSAVRAFLCRAPWLCRAHLIAVRPRPPFAVRRRPTRTTKPALGTPPRHQNAQARATWPLCHVYAHGNVTKCPLPCAYTWQRARFIFCFFYFLLFTAFQNLRYTYMHIYNLKYIKHTKYMHTYNLKYIKHTTNRSKYSYRVHITS
jgi:hypothetical protein